MAHPPEIGTISRRHWRIDRGKALVLSALCWAAFALMLWLVTTNGVGAFDKAGLLVWRTQPTLAPKGPAWLLEWVRDLTSLGSILLRNLIAIGAVIALLFLRLRRDATTLALTVIGGWIVDGLIKHAVDRPRPDIVPLLTEAGGPSFPSGHAFNSAVVYIAIALAFASLSERPSVRRTLVGTAIVLSLAIAWSRVWLGVHNPSDVIAGWLGGAGWALLAAAAISSLAPRSAA